MDFLEFIKAAIIGVVQGITEWLPVSSTGHIILLDQFMPLNFSKAFMDMFFVVIQLGSILAVVVLYFHKLNPFSSKKSLPEKRETYALWGKVLVGSIPAAALGFLLDDFIHVYCYGPFLVAAMLILYGVLFIVVENIAGRPHITRTEQISYKLAFLIGLFQALALIPGTSRSGATIIGATMFGVSRAVAAQFSFFLAIPAMFGASGFKILKYLFVEGMPFTSFEMVTLLVGMGVAFVVSLWAIKFLMGFVREHSFKGFGYYRIVLGVVICVYFGFAATFAK